MRRMYVISPALVIICWLALGVGCQKQTEKTVVLARVNNAVLSLRDMEDNIPIGFQEMFSREQKMEFINRWVEDELLHQEALHDKLHLDEDIANAINQLTREFLIQKLLERKLDKDVTMPEEEIKAYYNRNMDKFILEHPTIRAQQILVKDSKTAWQIKGMLQKGEPFGELARTYSLDPSSEMEGDMGYLAEWDLDPQLSKRCFWLNKDDVSSPIKSQSGYHIIKVLDKRQKGDPKPLVMVREKIINDLTKQKKKESLEALIRELKGRYTITMDLTILDQAPEPVASLPGPDDTGLDEDTSITTDAQDKY